MNTESSLIVSDIENYFKFLNPNPKEIFTCVAMNATSDRVIQGFGTWFVCLKDILRDFPSMHAQYGATLHTTLNQTKLSGRKNKDIEGVRVLCVDLDHQTPSDTLKEIIGACAVQMVVESSPGKYHLYWRLDPSLLLCNWKEFQLGLAHKLGGDSNLSHIGHTIRVPGIPRICKDGSSYTPQIVWLCPPGECVALTYNDVLETFPRIFDWANEAQAAKNENRKQLRKPRATSDALKVGERKEGRNCTLFNLLFYSAMTSTALSPDLETEISAIAHDANSKFETPLPDDEVLRVIESACMRGLDARLNKEEMENEKLQLLTPVENDDSAYSSNDGGAVGSLDAHLKPEAPIHKTNGSHLVDAQPTTPKSVAGQPNSNDNMNGQAGVNGQPADSTTITVQQIRNAFDYDFTDPLLIDNRYTEQGIAARAAQKFKDYLLRVDRDFYAFNTERGLWVPQDTDRLTESLGFIHSATRDILHEPGFKTLFCMRGKKQDADKTRAAQERFMSIRLQTQSARLLRNLPSIREETSDIFDSQEELFYCANGVLNMITGELRPVKATDYLRAQSGIAYDPDAKCPWWEEYLSQVFAGNWNTQEIVDFIQEMFGYSLSGSISEQVLFLHSGDGCNGKSKVLSVLAYLAGEYGTYVDSDEIVRSAKTGFIRNTEKLGAKLEGHRVAIIDDIDVKTNWNESFVKTTTSPTIRARGEYERSRVIANHCTLHLGLNVAPAPDAENYGLLRRMCIIPYNVRFKPDAGMSNEIDRMIREEASGILAWAVRGYQRRLSHGGTLVYPTELLASLEEYREANFKLETIIEQLFSVPENENDGTWEYIPTLVNDVNKYLQMAGEGASVSAESLGRALKRIRGIQIKKIWNAERKNAFKAVFIKKHYETSETCSLKSII